MIKGSLFHKCLSIVMVVALLAGLASPAAAALSDSYGEESYSDYVALGDAATYGVGLDDDILNYSELVAEALGCADSLSAYADARYRIEEIRYLLDDDYDGDAYTGKLKIKDTIRDEVKGQVAHAKYITINVGMNNFATYIVEQMMYYAENGGATKYSYSFDDFADENMVEAMENVKSIVMERLLAASPETGDKALELINFVTEVSVYAVLSYVTSFNATVNSIYELNPDVDIYVVGLYNFCEGEHLSLTVEGRTIDIPIGDVFGALIELANMYIQLFGDRVSNPYVYVDPGKPELLIDQMGNTSLSTDERIPDGLMAELIELAGDSAIDGIVELFKEYGLDWTNEDAEEFLFDLVSYSTTEERVAFIKSELLSIASEIAYETFMDQLTDKLGKFTDVDVSEEDIKKLLNDLDNAQTEGERSEVAGAFVDSIIYKEEVLNQAAAQVIYEYIQGYEISEYVEVTNIVELLEDLNSAAPADREAVVSAWVHDLAVKKVTEYVVSRVGEDKYNNEMADEMLTAMEADPENAQAIAKEHLWNDVFKSYLSAEFEGVFADQTLPLVGYADFNAFADAIYAAGDDYEEIVRNAIRASAAHKLSATVGGFIEGEQIVEWFATMDGMENDSAKKAYLQGELGSGLGALFTDPIWSVYCNYTAAADAAIENVGKFMDAVDTAADALTDYVEIQNTVVDDILTLYAQHYDEEEGKLDLSSFADFAKMREDAVNEILNGYDNYTSKIDEAMDKADAYNGDLDNVYLTLMSIAEINTINLNAIVNVGKNVYNGGNSYIESVVDDVLTNTLGEGEKTIAYLAVRYFLGNAMMIMPSAKGHQTIANNIIKAIENGEDVNSDFGYWGNKIIDGSIDLYRCAKAFIKNPDQASGQLETLINPDNYVALGDNITSGTALAGDKNYVELLAEALAMEFEDIADFDQDVINNLAINGMRTEELYALVSNYAGDAYTDSRFSDIASLRDEYLAAIQDAELITIEVGINNLVTYPLTQTLLAYNDKDTHEMDWAQYIGENRAEKLSKGKDAVMKLLLHVVDSVDNRVVKEATDKPANDECRIALNTVSTAIESMAYGLLGYAVHLDASVEEIADMNEDATIVLVGFYNPLEDTTFIVDETVSHGSHSVDLSQYEVKVEYIGEFMLEIADRFLANYVGNTRGGENANDEGSRLLNVKINDAPLGIHNSGVSMDLADLNGQATITVKGHSVTFPVPEYFDELYHAGSNALHPSAEGHQYICDEILKVLDFEIHADVVPEDNWKYYGDEDPELTFVMDDKSSLYDELIVELTREAGEDVGFYDISASLLQKTGYYEVDLEVGVFEIKAMPVTIEVVKSESITVGDAIPEFSVVVKDIYGNVLSGVNVEITGIPADSNTVGDYTISATLNETNYVLAEGGLTTATLTIEQPSDCEHEWKDVEDYENHPDYVAPTCIQKGTMPTVCSKCGEEGSRVIVPLGHDYKLVDAGTVPANCQETGTRPSYECSHCGATKGGETYKGEHDWSAWTVITEATCTQNGLRIRVCNVCGTKQVSTTGKLAHDVDEWNIIKEPDCENEGLKEGYCKRCDQVVTVAIPKLGHAFEGEVQGVEPTCTEPGWRSGYCSRCGKEVYEVLGALGHSLDFDQYIHACQRDDCYFWEYHTLVTGEKYIECACGYKCRVELVIENITLDKYPDAMVEKFGSTENLLEYFNNAAEELKENVKEENSVVVDVDLIVEMVTDSGDAISTDKAQAGVHYNAEEGHPVSLDIPSAIVGKTDHYEIYVFHMLTTPDSAGEYVVEEIVNLDIDTENNKINFTMHSFSPVMISWVCKHDVCTIIDAVIGDCTTTGYTEGLKCDICEEFLIEPEQVAGTGEGHKWTAWEDKGSNVWERECTVCGETESKTVTCSHDWVVEIDTDATCDVDGHYKAVCSKCGEIDEYTIPAGHSWVVEIDIDATCEDDGHYKAVCSKCGEVDEYTIPARHSWVQVEYTKATCVTLGHVKNVCSKCDAIWEYNLSLKDHTWGEWQWTDELTEVRTCSVCGATQERNYVCWNTRTGVKYEIVHLAVLDAQPGDTIQMLADSDQTQKTDVYDYAADINLINGVTLDLAGFTLKVNSLFAAEGNYLTADYETADGIGGRLHVPAENFVLNDTYYEGDFKGSKMYVLPFWLEDEGCYVFARFGITDANTDEQGLIVDVGNDVIYYRFDHFATGFVNQNYIAGSGIGDNSLSVEVYLQWKTPTGVSYQHYVFDEDVIDKAAGTSDYYYMLTNFSELSIDINTLTITARIVSESGATVVGVTRDANGNIVTSSTINNGVNTEYTFVSSPGNVCVNMTTGVEYAIVHEAVLDASPDDVIQMIANSDQTALKGLCPSAGMVSLTNGVTLDLQGYVLKLDALFVAEGSYVIANYETGTAIGGRLVVPAENLVLCDSYYEGDFKGAKMRVLPFWLEDEGCYVFGRFGLTDSQTDLQGLEINVAQDIIYYRFDHFATGFLNQNFFTDNGIGDNGLSIEVYLQWETPTGVSYQHFVFEDTVIGQAAGSADYYYTLTNFSQLSIDLDSLVISARIVSDCGATYEGLELTIEDSKT